MRTERSEAKAIGTQPMGPRPVSSPEIGHAPSIGQDASEFEHAESGGLSPEQRHRLHTAHTEIEATKSIATLAREAPEAAEALIRVIESTRLSGILVRQLADSAKFAPKAMARAFDYVASHPAVADTILPACRTIGQACRNATVKLLAAHPGLTESAAARFVSKAAGKATGKIIPVAGVVIAGWGTTEALGASLDPRVSWATKAKYWTANAADWGAALGGLAAETGFGEIAALGAATASIFLYADAEASREGDLAGKAAHAR